MWELARRCTSLAAANEELVPLLLATAFHATPAHHKRAVNTALDLADAWLCAISPDPAAPLPAHIAPVMAAFLERALARLLASLHFQVLRLILKLITRPYHPGIMVCCMLG